MRKTTIIIITVLFAAALLVAAYFIRKEKLIVVIDPWEAVPADAFFIVETVDFPELLTAITDPAGIMSGFSGPGRAASLVKAAAVIDSVTGSREVRSLISNRQVILSFHTTGRGRVMPLAVMNTGSSFTGRRLASLCRQAGAVVTERRNLTGVRSYSVIFGSGESRSSLSMALTSGILIITTSEELMAAALESRSTGSDIRRQKDFAPVAAASGKGSDNLYVLFRNLPGFLTSFITPGEVNTISSVAIAGGGDLAVAGESLSVSGFLTVSDGGAGLLAGVAPEVCGVHELLPGSTLSYTTVMRRALLTGEAAVEPASLNASELALTLSPFTGTEVTDAVIALNKESERVRLFRMIDRQSAESELRQRLTAKYRSMGLRENSFITSVSRGNGEEWIIYRMPFDGVASALAGREKSRGGDRWLTFARSYMIFSDSPDILAKLLGESESDNTLINDAAFRMMEKSLPTKSSWLFYASGSRLREIMCEHFTPEAAATLTGGSMAAIDGVGISLTPSNGMIYTTLTIRYHSGGAEAGRVMSADQPGAAVATGSDSSALRLLWKVKLDAEPSVAPFFFTNHNNGATELFVQDKNNSIYLISSAGRVLWKASIRERIRGDIFMIDYYKNGKNQLLFAGSDYLHLIDRNGNYVDKYPVRLRSAASNTLALFDYENNKDYRLCIAGEDRKIYVYDRSGELVRGWNLFTTRGLVTEPVAFFRVRGKDYLVAADDQDIYVLDRTGNIRVVHQQPLVKAPGSAVRLLGGDEPALLFSATDGSTVRVLFDGTVKKSEVTGLTPEHRTEFGDVDGDNIPDRLTVDNSEITVTDLSGNKIWSGSFVSAKLSSPRVVTTATGERRTAVYEAGTGTLHLLGRNGVSMQGFPLKTGPFFSIGRVTGKNSWNLVVNEDETYICNYELVAGFK